LTAVVGKDVDGGGVAEEENGWEEGFDHGE
jgi:hypothetical protein